MYGVQKTHRLLAWCSRSRDNDKMKQTDLDLDLARSKTRKAQFLDEMERAASWGALRALIAPPSSTKNRTGTRDPELHQTQQGNPCHFGRKALIGVDADCGLAHTVVGTAANFNDVTQTHRLVRGSGSQVFADVGYQGVDERTPMRANLGKPEKAQACIRAKVEHPFRVIKRQISRTPVRCRGLANKTAQIPAQSDLWLARRRLLVAQGVRDPRSTLPWGRNDRGGMHRSAQGSRNA